MTAAGCPRGPASLPESRTIWCCTQFDLPARKAEREERLLAFNNGDVNETLWDICRQGGGNDARFLLAHGADANHGGEGGMSVLARAAHSGHLTVVEALLYAGAGELESGLEMAADRGHTAVAALLLDRGADVHHEGDNALYWAAVQGRLEMVTFLLQRGATARNDILANAMEYGHHAIADLLRAHGAV